VAGQGRRYSFHGAFGTKASALCRERARPDSFVKKIKFRKGPNKGQVRFLVVKEKRRR
jgi:hypothetical protein